MSAIESITNGPEKWTLFKAEPESIRKPPGKCKACGNPVQSKPGPGRTRQYCDKACSRRAHSRLRKGEPAIDADFQPREGGWHSFRKHEKQCVACGKGFEAPSPQRFCSSECRIGHRNHGLDRSCETCGKEFKGGVTAKYCSSRCWPSFIATPVHDLICEGCKQPFQRRGDESFRRFCSRPCAKRSNWGKAVEAWIAKAELKTFQCKSCDVYFTRKEASYPDEGFCSDACKNRVFELTCIVCWAQFESKNRKANYCGKNCRNLKYYENRIANGSYVLQKATLECVECGKSFSVEKASSVYKYCSARCLKRVDKRKRRAYKRNAYVEPVHLAALIRRDIGVCQICKKTVDLAATVPDNLAATVDHVIPLSKGGQHSYANCQLAHFICNSYKNDHVDVLF